jgi:hypothetical protein
MQGLQQATRNREKKGKEAAKGRQIAVSLIIRLRIHPRACPWMNAQTINMLRRDVAPKLRRITAS